MGRQTIMDSLCEKIGRTTTLELVEFMVEVIESPQSFLSRQKDF